MPLRDRETSEGDTLLTSPTEYTASSTNVRTDDASPTSLKPLPYDEKQPDATDTTQYLKTKNLTHELALLSIICTGQILCQAGLSQSLAILHIINRDFHATTAELTWTISAYSLTFGTFILLAGRLGDIYGHKRLYIIGLLCYGLWALLAGFSVYSGQILFDICRAFQGLGSAIIMPTGTALLGRTYPPGRRKEMAISIFGACAPNGFILGALFAGLFAQLTWWPWLYWFTGMACVAIAVASFSIIPTAPPIVEELQLVRTITKSRLSQKLEELDVLGACTGISGLVLLNFAWNQGAVVGWPVPYTYILLIVGILFLLAFTYIELHVATNPLVPIREIAFDSAFALGCIALGWSSFGIFIYYLWQLYEVLRLNTPLTGTAQFVPTGVSGAIAAVTTGYLISRVSPGWVMLGAMTAFGVGNVLAATAPVDQTYWAQTFVAAIVTPWGMDMSFPSAIIILSDAMPPRKQGAAASLVTTVQNYSIAIGLGVAGTVESNVNKGGMEVLRGYRGAWYAGIGLDGLGMVVAGAYLVLSLSRRKKQKTGLKQSEGDV